LYALVVRHFSKKLLAVLVLLSAAAVLHLGLTSHDGDFPVAGRWTGRTLHIGFTGLMFRMGKILRVPHAFWVCSGLIVVVLTLPRFVLDEAGDCSQQDGIAMRATAETGRISPLFICLFSTNQF